MKEIEHHFSKTAVCQGSSIFYSKCQLVKVTERSSVKLENGASLMMDDYYKQCFFGLMDAHLVKTSRTPDKEA